MVIRLSYLALIITGVRLVFFTFEENPLLTIVKIVFALMTIGVCEMAVRPNVSKKMRYLAIGLMLLTAVTGLVLAEGAPFV